MKRRILHAIRTYLCSSLILLFGLIGFECVGQFYVSNQYLGQTSAAVIGFVSPIPANYNVDLYRITYNTTDTQGEPTVASGAIAIPQTQFCNSFPMLAYCHGTVLRQLDVPSYQNTESGIVSATASAGFISVAPDYLGLGVNPGRHPYLHAESQATATIDLVRAAREFLETLPQQDNGELFITGYSQGGHAAMATLKYAEDNNLNEELGIVAGAPMSGPYNLSGTQTDILLSDQPYSNPGYVIYLIMSYELVYGNLYNELGDVVKSPYDEEVQPFFDGMQNQFDMGSVNAILPNQLSELLQDSTLSNFESNPTHPLRIALSENDNYDWTPSVPIRMYYCDGDEQVNFQNSLDAEEAMLANGADDVDAINAQPGASHGGCVLPAFSLTYNFFNSMASGCSLVTGTSDIDEFQLKLYPNPASDRVQITNPYSESVLQIHSLEGKLILKENLFQSSITIDVSQFPSGVYICTLLADGKFLKTALVVD